MKANTKQFDTFVRIRCVHCWEDNVIFLKSNEYTNWLSGAGFIQDCMPSLSAAERELILSKTCGKCFDKIVNDWVDKTFS